MSYSNTSNSKKIWAKPQSETGATAGASGSSSTKFSDRAASTGTGSGSPSAGHGKKRASTGPASKASSMRKNPGGIHVYKIVILGDGGVGKSALTMQFVSHRFLDYHDPTIEDSYQQQTVIDGEPAKLDILDTAGQPEFNAMRDQHMRQGEGFIVCYSISDHRSFDEAIAYKKMVDRVRGTDDIPMVLVGNKCDLEHARKVHTEEGQILAHQWNCPFYETSAAWRQCVDDTFYELIREIRRKERLEEKASKKSKSTLPKPLRSILKYFHDSGEKT